MERSLAQTKGTDATIREASPEYAAESLAFRKPYSFKGIPESELLAEAQWRVYNEASRMANDVHRGFSAAEVDQIADAAMAMILRTMREHQFYRDNKGRTAKQVSTTLARVFGYNKTKDGKRIRLDKNGNYPPKIMDKIEKRWNTIQGLKQNGLEKQGTQAGKVVLTPGEAVKSAMAKMNVAKNPISRPQVIGNSLSEVGDMYAQAADPITSVDNLPNDPSYAGEPDINEDAQDEVAAQYEEANYDFAESRELFDSQEQAATLQLDARDKADKKIFGAPRKRIKKNGTQRAIAQPLIPATPVGADRSNQEGGAGSQPVSRTVRAGAKPSVLGSPRKAGVPSSPRQATGTGHREWWDRLLLKHKYREMGYYSNVETPYTWSQEQSEMRYG